MPKINRTVLAGFPQETRLDAGRYIAEVVKVEEKEASTGRYYLAVQARITEGPTQENDTDPEGKFLFFNLMFPVPGDKDTTVSMFNGRMNGFISALGDSVPAEMDTGDSDDLEQLVGLEFGIKFIWKKDKKSGEENFEPKNFFVPGE